MPRAKSFGLAVIVLESGVAQVRQGQLAPVHLALILRNSAQPSMHQKERFVRAVGPLAHVVLDCFDRRGRCRHDNRHVLILRQGEQRPLALARLRPPFVSVQAAPSRQRTRCAAEHALAGI